MTPTQTIQKFEDAVQSNAQRLGLSAEASADGLRLSGGNAMPQVIVQGVLEGIDLDHVQIVSDARSSGGVVAAFEIAEPGTARTYSLVKFGEAKSACASVASSGRGDSSRSFFQMMKTPYNEPAFFTVMGPEGVGKTTLCEGIERVFEGYPVPLVQFHHTGAWKSKLREVKTDQSEKGAIAAVLQHSPQRSLPYRIAQLLWRKLIPTGVKDQIGGFLGEFTYMRNVMSLLVKAHDDGHVVVADRYCYDRYVRWGNMKKPLLQRFASYLTCHMMRRPFHAFVLHDTPDRIFARKQTMPLWEIELHLKHLKDVGKAFMTKYEIVDVSQFPDAEGVRETVIRKLLVKLGPKVFDLMDASSD